MTLFRSLTLQAAELGHNPAVVFRHDRSGERTELSFATLHNWVAKTANLLVDDFDAGLGSTVAVGMPAHWTVPIMCLAAWAAGAAVTIDTQADVRVAHEEDPGDRADILIGSGLGGRLTGSEGDAATVADILAQPDDFVDDPGDEGAWAVGGRTQATLLAEGVPAGNRILVAAEVADEPLALLIARTLPAGASLVIARGFDAAGLARVADQEQALPL